MLASPAAAAPPVRVIPGKLTHPSPNHTARAQGIKVECYIVHWTGGTYASAVDWCCRDESNVSYQLIIGPKPGQIAYLVPWDRACQAVGTSRAPRGFTFGRSGNSASDNIALAGGPPTGPTEFQRETLVSVLAERMQARGHASHEVHRILGHDQVAVFPALDEKGRPHPFAGKLGRKTDPQGKGWLPLDPIRAAVAAQLLLGGGGS